MAIPAPTGALPYQVFDDSVRMLTATTFTGISVISLLIYTNIFSSILGGAGFFFWGVPSLARTIKPDLHGQTGPIDVIASLYAHVKIALYELQQGSGFATEEEVKPLKAACIKNTALFSTEDAIKLITLVALSIFSFTAIAQSVGFIGLTIISGVIGGYLSSIPRWIINYCRPEAVNIPPAPGEAANPLSDMWRKTVEGVNALRVLGGFAPAADRPAYAPD